MKKSFLILSFLLVVTSLTTFAHLNHEVDPRAEQAFKREFAGAANVLWGKTGDFLKASFLWADHQAVAYFNADGELVGCIRGLFFNQLPLTVIRSVQRNYTNAAILETMEISNETDVSYKLIMEYKNKKYEVSLNSFGDILDNKKLKK
jgi:hypothetical protein